MGADERSALDSKEADELVLGRFRPREAIAARLGGRAFLAEDEGTPDKPPAAGSPHPVVELHLIPLETAPQAAFDEAARAVDALAGTSDPSVPRPLFVVWSAEALVIVCEHAEGRPLADVLAETALDPLRALEVFRGLMHAVALLARAKVSHDAIVPRRILVSPERVVLLDAGLTAFAAPGPESEAHYLGAGAVRGEAASVFAAATIGLELLAGKPGARLAPPEPRAVATHMAGEHLIELLASIARDEPRTRGTPAAEVFALIPKGGRRRRRAEYDVAEVWDHVAVGPNTARLVRAGTHSEELAPRLPEVRAGAAPAAAVDRAAPDYTDAPSLAHPEADKRDAGRREMERLAGEQLARERAAEGRALEKRALERQQQEQLAREKLAQEKLAQEKLAQEKLAQEHAQAAKLAPDRLAQEKWAHDKLAQDKLAQQKLAQDKLAPDKSPPPKNAEDAFARELEHGSAGQKTIAVTPPPPPPPPPPRAASLAPPPGNAAPPLAPAPSTIATPARQTPRPAADVKATTLVLVPENGPRRLYFLVGGANASLGRERGNQVVLRAFLKSGDLDATETNRISRQHLFVRFEDKRVSIRDEKSAFHTFLGPRGRSTQLPHRVEVELPAEFELGVAESAVRAKGRVFSDATGAPEAVRFARADDEAAHHYILVRSRAQAGSDERTAALLFEDVGTSAATLELDAQGRFVVRALSPGVAVDGIPLAPSGEPALLTGADLFKLGAVELRVREAKEEDFLRPAGAG